MMPIRHEIGGLNDKFPESFLRTCGVQWHNSAKLSSEIERFATKNILLLVAVKAAEIECPCMGAETIVAEIPFFTHDFVMDRNMGLLFRSLASSVTQSEFDIGSMSRSNQLVWVTNFLEDVLVRS